MLRPDRLDDESDDSFLRTSNVEAGSAGDDCEMPWHFGFPDDTDTPFFLSNPSLGESRDSTSSDPNLGDIDDADDGFHFSERRDSRRINRDEILDFEMKTQMYGSCGALPFESQPPKPVAQPPLDQPLTNGANSEDESRFDLAIRMEIGGSALRESSLEFTDGDEASDSSFGGSPEPVEPPRNRKREAPEALDRNINQRRKFQQYQWSQEEEVFLIGSILDRFFEYGSLTTQRKGKSKETGVWESIKAKFDRYRQCYYKNTNSFRKPRVRSANALKRHWKIMKASRDHTFYEKWKIWDNKYASLSTHTT